MIGDKNREGSDIMENQFSKRVTYNGLSVKYALGPTSLRGNEIHTYHEMLYFMTSSDAGSLKSCF